LVLTSWYLPIRVVAWQTAVKMTYLGSVDVVAEYQATISSPSVTWRLPAVIRLRRVAPCFRKGVKYSPTNVKIRDNYCCQYCGQRYRSSELTMDHVVPRSQGGQRTFENIVSACRPCNNKKADKSCDEVGMFPLSAPAAPRGLPFVSSVTRGAKVPEEWAPFLHSARI
jgi:5-methylcytosine-specific restriction endonuclease McrA